MQHAAMMQASISRSIIFLNFLKFDERVTSLHETYAPQHIVVI